jgi:hypothetical protein
MIPIQDGVSSRRLQARGKGVSNLKKCLAHRHDVMQAMEELDEDVEAYLQQIAASRSNDLAQHKQEKAVIVTKFVVPPDQCEDFIEEIKELKKSLKEEDGNEMFSVAKTKVGQQTFGGF